MATAQILIVVKSPADVSREAFQAAVESAARAAGVATSSWSYDATPVLLEREADSAFVQTVKGGPWDGAQFTSGRPLPAGQSSAVLSAYRQNVVGLSETTARLETVMTGISSSVRAALAPLGEVRSAFRTIRHPISWDRGIPRAISIGGSGGGTSRGVVAAAGIFGVLTLAAIYGARR